MLWFEVLKIEETSDIKKIRSAYSKILKTCSPEKDPEGFQNIRDAYEEGTKEARKCKKEVEVPEKIINPVHEFMNEFEENYNCYENRINVYTWKKLLDKDICYNIETANVIGKKIMEFIIENYYMPAYVYSLFNDYFSWETNMEDLYDNFNIDVVNYIFKQIKDGDNFKYEYLLGVENGKHDIFIREYKEACSLIKEGNFEAAKVSLDIANEICPNHPDLIAITASYLINKKEYEKAIEILTKCIEVNKDYANAYFFRGECFYQLDECGKAIDDFEKAYELDNTMNIALYWLSLVNNVCGIYSKGLDYLEKLKELPYERDSIESLNRISYREYLKFLISEGKLDPKKCGGVYFPSLALYETKDYSGCISFIKKSFDNNIVTSNLYYLYCKSLMALGKVNESIELISKVIKSCDTNYKLYYFKGDALQSLGLYEESIIEYKKALELNSNNGALFNSIALSSYELGNGKEALKYAQKAIDLNKFNGNYYVNKINSLLLIEYYEEALYICEEALELDSTCSNLYKCKMRILSSMGNYNEALAVYEECKNLDLITEELNEQRTLCLLDAGMINEVINAEGKLRKKDPKFNFQIGMAYFNKEDYINAINYFGKARKYDKLFRDAYIYEGMAYEIVGKNNVAIVLWEKAIKLKFKNLWEFHYLVGMLWCKTGGGMNGFEHFTKAIEINPGFAPSYNERAIVNIDLDKLEDALSDVKVALKIDNENTKSYNILLYIYKELGKKDSIVSLCEYIENNNIDVDTQSYKAITSLTY